MNQSSSRPENTKSLRSVRSVVNTISITQAQSTRDIEQIRALFQEYAQSIGFSLCFQGFDAELAGLPGEYAPPYGRLLLARFDERPAGCVALHRIDAEICEMKRLFLRPEFRGHRLGRALIDGILSEARQIGYRRMRLDTVEPVMGDAVALYRKYGFREIAPYRHNPMPGTLYMELDLYPLREEAL
jgi:putative acetyltransferase